MAKVVIYSRVGEATATIRNALTAAAIPFTEVRSQDGSARAIDIAAQVPRVYTSNEMKELLQEIAVSVKKIESVIL